ncbi:ESX-1 secretion-associated protein [Mycobacterium sp. MBM]|nr:ESX-1 secretion-associated protein [Mycobacterium sp. MBM]
MTDPLFAQTDGVRDLAEVHSRVAAGLSGLRAAEGTGVQRSHGAIASAVSTALDDALAGRAGTLDVTSTSAATIADLLQKAAGAYAAGDEEGGSRLQAAAAALAGENGVGDCDTYTSGSAPPAGPDAAGGDIAGQLGQIMGQVGQQVGQIAQAVTTPLQGLASGLQQVPQQLIQGLQQAVQAAQADRLDAPDEAEKPDGEREDTAEGEDAARDREPAEPTPALQAQPSQELPAGRSPVETSAPARPAPTRPQVG